MLAASHVLLVREETLSTAHALNGLVQPKRSWYSEPPALNDLPMTELTMGKTNSVMAPHNWLKQNLSLPSLMV